MRYFIAMLSILFISACASKDIDSKLDIDKSEADSAIKVIEQEDDGLFLSYDKDIKNKQIKQYLKDGLVYAIDDNIAMACDVWETAISGTPISVSLYYNFAICNELYGNHEKAVSILFYAQDFAPNKKIRAMITEGISRNQKLIK